jgi:hypothetical protein
MRSSRDACRFPSFYSVFIFDLVVAVDLGRIKADELFCRPQKKKMNNLSQLLAFVNGARHVGLYILSSPDLSALPD